MPSAKIQGGQINIHGRNHLLRVGLPIPKGRERKHPLALLKLANAQYNVITATM